MGIPHHAFNCKFIMICFIIILSNLSTISMANAYDSLFIVEGVRVDVTAKNSVIAGERAFEQAQAKAFKILSQRMVEESQVQNIKQPDSLTISSLVKDYEITNEKLSAVRYVATYIFRFQEEAVSKFFATSGVDFTNESSKTLLVLPILQNGRKSILWSEGNVWMQAWSRFDISRGIVPIEVPIGDLMDITDINEDNALRYERPKLDRMLARYNAKEAAIMIAVPDDDLQNGGDLRISIYRTDSARAQHVRDIVVSSKNNETIEQIYDRGVTKAYRALQNDWKTKTLTKSSQRQIFYIRAPFKNIRQWVKIKQSLSNISGINDMSILSIKKTEAHLSFKFAGNEEHLRATLARSNLSLGVGYKSDPSSEVMHYDLTHGQKKRKLYQNIEPAAGYTF